MRAVAERAGVSAPTAYQYFASRDHVLVEVLTDLAAGTTSIVTARPSRRRDPVERTVATLRRVVQRMEEEPTLFVALLRAFLSGAPEVRGSRAGMQSSMREWVDSALGPAEVSDREAMVSILEAVLLTGLVSLVMGDNSPSDIGDDLERAVRLLLPPSTGS